MANKLYPKGVEALLAQDIDIPGDDIVLLALSSAGTYNAAHDTISDLGGAVIARALISTKTVTNGAFKGTVPNPTWEDVSTDIAYLAIAQDSGSDATSRLIEWRDEDDDLPLTQDGGDVIYTVHTDGFFTIE